MMTYDIIVKLGGSRMRVTKAVADKNRQAILDTATRLFKARGIDNVSVADLTKAAGFTHGGFYNHFESKADLAAEAIRYAFDQALKEVAGADRIDDPTGMAERLANYLSAEHRDHPDAGCPTGSLPVDAARQGADTQRAFAAGLERYLDLIQTTVPDAATDRRQAAIATLSRLVGAIILSRAVRVGDPALSDEFLRAGRPAG